MAKKVFCLKDSVLLKALEEIDRLILASAARNKYGVSGKGIRIAILDTGIAEGVQDHLAKEMEYANRSNENALTNVANGEAKDYGTLKHGSELALVIASEGDGSGRFKGIAPGCIIHNVKCFNSDGDAPWPNIREGLQYVLEYNKNHPQDKIRVVLMAIEQPFSAYSAQMPHSRKDSIRDIIQKLIQMDVAVIASSGNYEYCRGSMSYPAILDDVISVGAVDAKELDVVTPTPMDFGDGIPRRKSQLLPDKTTILAPGRPFPVYRSLKRVKGTSLAAACVAGAVLLIIELYLRKNSKFPSVPEIKRYLAASGVTVLDDVRPNKTMGAYPRLSIRASLDHI